MTIGFRARQVIGVNALVAGCMIALSTLHLASIMAMSLEESRTRGEMTARSVFHRARGVAAESTDVVTALGADAGVRAILESSIAYTQNVIYAAILDDHERAIVHSSPLLEGVQPPPGLDLNELLGRSLIGRLRGVYASAILELDEPIILGEQPFGSIRIGLSTVLIREELMRAARTAAFTFAVTMAMAMLVSIGLARRIVKPIHVIRKGLTRLGRGDADVALELPRGDDFAELGRSFEAVRTRLSNEVTTESSRKVASLGRLLGGVAHELKNPLHAMLVHVELLQQKLEVDSEPVAVSTGGLAASVLRVEALASGGSTRPPVNAGIDAVAVSDPRPQRPGIEKHVTIIAREIRRLDQSIRGFLNFIRPEELCREDFALADLVDEVLALVEPEATRRAVRLDNRCRKTLPLVNGDRSKLRDALLNLALNACHAMPSGGVLRVAGRAAGNGRVQLDMEDGGAGMTPEVLERVFDLYYTTKDSGSGIGLAMVYRTLLLHDGTIEVESTPGKGTRVRMTMPCL